MWEKFCELQKGCVGGKKLSVQWEKGELRLNGGDGWVGWLVGWAGEV